MGSAKAKYPWIYRSSLSIVFITLFLVTLCAQAFTGWKAHNEELKNGDMLPLSFMQYTQSGHFISATFENFESEFLQMALYVVLTVSLRQIGSSESKKLGVKEAVDREPQAGPKAPWPVKKGGWILTIYKHSLSLVFFLLFAISWGMHLYGSFVDHNVQQEIAGQPLMGMTEFLLKPDFWFETFQNWQSEFLSVAAIVIFTIFLRQQGSPESKPVDAPNLETEE